MPYRSKDSRSNQLAAFQIGVIDATTGRSSFGANTFRRTRQLFATDIRCDTVQKRVVYQPVTIEPRENTPRIVREDGFGGVQ